MKMIRSMMLAACTAAVTVTAFAEEASHRQAAAALVDTCGLEAVVEEARNDLINTLGAIAENGDRYWDLFATYVNEQLAWHLVRKDIETIYMEVFNEQELKELEAFYQTPLGARLLKEGPGIGKRIDSVIRGRFEERLEQLEVMIKNRDFEELERDIVPGDE